MSDPGAGPGGPPAVDAPVGPAVDAPVNGPFLGVVFDMDGIVGDTEHLWDQSWAAYAAAHRTPWEHRDSVDTMGMSVPEWSALLVERTGSGETAEQAADFCVQYIVGKVRAGEAGLMPGGPELVRFAASRVPIALATSSARPIIEVLLRDGGLYDLFGAIVTSAEVARGKPSPDVYLEAARQIGLTGRAGIGIEDSGNGIRSAHGAGLYVIAIPNRQFPPRPEALALAHFVAADHADALAHLTGLLDPAPA